MSECWLAWFNAHTRTTHCGIVGFAREWLCRCSVYVAWTSCGITRRHTIGVGMKFVRFLCFDLHVKGLAKFGRVWSHNTLGSRSSAWWDLRMWYLRRGRAQQ
jgi:hypothetical protein